MVMVVARGLPFLGRIASDGLARDLDNTPRSVRQGLYPEGHSRGTPGIVSGSQPTLWARQFFGG